MKADTVLDEEIRYFDGHLQEWLSQFAGRFVLVKGREIRGVFNTDQEALTEGARQFGLTSFLVRRVEPVQQEVKLPALTFGLLNADSARPVQRTTAGH